MLKAIRIVLYGLVAVALGWYVYLLQQNEKKVAAKSTQKQFVAMPKQKLGGLFELTSHTGERVHNKDFLGQYQLVYFGYTHCPDICPTELFTITTAVEELEKKKIQVQPIFVTIDPERDTLEHLKQYVSLFHPKLIALRGDEKETEAIKSLYKVYAVKNSDDTSAMEYMVDHSTYVYLLGKDGQVITLFRHATPAENVIKMIEKLEVTGSKK